VIGAPAVAPAPEAESRVGAIDAPNLTPPPGNPRFPLLDSLRAVAALCVFAGHTVTGVLSLRHHPGLFVWAAQLAYEGVAIFFLLSGFLLYRPFLTARRGGHGLSIASYARRRALRIVPAYWAALTIFLAAGFVGGVTAGNWWVFYGFGQIYSSTMIGHGIGVAWTLCIEVTFYAALPLFALGCLWLGRGAGSLRPDAVALALLAAGSLAFRAHFSSFLQVATVSTLPGTFFWFALGMACAIASVRRQERALRAAPAGAARRADLWPAASWVVAVALFALLHRVRPGWLGLGVPGVAAAVHVLYGLSALFALLPAVFAEDGRGPVQRILRNRLLAWIGLVSYAFYLYHTIVIAQLARLAGHLGISARYAPVAAASLVVSLACAAASYYLLERPAMRWGRSRRPRRGAGTGRPPGVRRRREVRA